MTKKKAAAVCPLCKINITKKDYSIKCQGGCNKYVHKKCSGLAHEKFTAYANKETNQKWLCKLCLDDSEASTLGDPSDTEIEDSFKSAEKKNSDGIAEDLVEILNKNNPTVKEVLHLFNKKFEEFEKSLEFKWKIIEDLNTTIKDMKLENKKLRKENEEIRNQLHQVQQDIAKVKVKVGKDELEERKKNVIIAGLRGNDNIVADVQRVFATIKSPIESGDYEVKILPSQRENKLLLIKFKSSEKRNNVLECRKEYGSLDTEKCGLMGEKINIYINEDLDFDTRQVLVKAKNLKTKGYKYIWVRNANVYVRKAEGSELIKIKNMEQLNALMDI